MAPDLKVVHLSNFVSNLDEFIALEFDQLFALAAIKMIMLGIAVIVFVNAAAGQQVAVRGSKQSYGRES